MLQTFKVDEDCDKNRFQPLFHFPFFFCCFLALSLLFIPYFSAKTWVVTDDFDDSKWSNGKELHKRNTYAIFHLLMVWDHATEGWKKRGRKRWRRCRGGRGIQKKRWYKKLLPPQNNHLVHICFWTVIFQNLRVALSFFPIPEPFLRSRIWGKMLGNRTIKLWKLIENSLEFL